MKTVAPVALVLLCLTCTAAVSGDATTETLLTAAPGDLALLPCPGAGKVTPAAPVWTKDGQEVITGGGVTTTPDGQRLTVLHDGTLSIQGVTPGDEGAYLCGSTRGTDTFRARVQLQVAAGPANVSASIGPATALSNGSLIVFRGETVQFNCSGSSYPSQQLTWAFAGASSANRSLASTSGSWLDFRIEDVQPGAQGLYSCLANNTVSHQTVNKSTQLLVYYAPDRHPECSWSLGLDPSDITFICTWFGAYPAPSLRWGEDQGEQGDHWTGHVYASEVTESLSLSLNRSSLTAGQTLRCMAQHMALSPGKQKNCSFTLKPPFPEGEPLVTALEETSVTLICSEEVSTPPANTTWRRGLQQEVIVPGSKYVLTEEGPVYKLAILNVSHDDEGVYFCRSENPLGVQELEVYLTVRTSSAYTGAIIGIFIAVLIVGLAVVIARTVYSSRHRICLGNGFGPVDDDRGDVLSLVESDDEQIFQDAVPRLPPLTNGHQTTLVQIHRIPSSDHEDGGNDDTSSQQLDDTEQREEPEDLVTF